MPMQSKDGTMIISYLWRRILGNESLTADEMLIRVYRRAFVTGFTLAAIAAGVIVAALIWGVAIPFLEGEILRVRGF